MVNQWVKALGDYEGLPARASGQASSQKATDLRVWNGGLRPPVMFVHCHAVIGSVHVPSQALWICWVASEAVGECWPRSEETASAEDGLVSAAVLAQCRTNEAKIIERYVGKIEVRGRESSVCRMLQDRSRKRGCATHVTTPGSLCWGKHFAQVGARWQGRCERVRAREESTKGTRSNLLSLSHLYAMIALARSPADKTENVHWRSERVLMLGLVRESVSCTQVVSHLKPSA